MGSESIDVVRDGFETLAEDGYEALLPLVHPEFEVTTPPTLASEPDTYRGPDGVRRWFESFYDAMDSVDFITRSLEEIGPGLVLAELTLRARGQHSGISAEQQPVALIRLEGGLLRKMELFTTAEEALSAAGIDAG